MIRMIAPLLIATFLVGPAAATPSFVDEGIILRAPATGPFRAGMGAPTVDYDVATDMYSMYFEAPNPETPAECETSYSIGRATSADGVNWTLDTEPVIAPDTATPGSPFHCVVSQPAVVFDGTTWHLFFSMASEPVVAGEPNAGSGIGYAISADGENFTVQNAPLVGDSGVAMGLASAVIVDGELVLAYVWRPDLRVATLPVDGSANWTFSTVPAVDHTNVGAWASQWVLSPSLFCEDDQVNPFTLVFAGDDEADQRNMGVATSADARSWNYDPGNPLTSGDLDYGSLNHWDVLEAGPDYLMWYSRTDETTGLKGIGFARSGVGKDPVGPRMCPHPDPEPPPDTGSTDSAAPPGETGTKTEDMGGCGCATTLPPPTIALVVLLGALGVRRRA